MVVGRSWMESGSEESVWEGARVEGSEWEGSGGGIRGTRLNFVLEGWVSASSSRRKEFSSCSAISSRERVFV